MDSECERPMGLLCRYRRCMADMAPPSEGFCSEIRLTRPPAHAQSRWQAKQCFLPKCGFRTCNLQTRSENQRCTSKGHLKTIATFFLTVTKNFRFTEIPHMSAPNMPISHYGAGIAERVTTV